MNIVAKTKRFADSVAFNLRVHGFADRKYLREVMLPATAEAEPSNVMLAGTRRYNTGYPKLFDQQTTAVWTLDFDPRAARFGNGHLHRTCDIREIDRVFSGIRFDVVHINGLLGFGINTDGDIKLMIEAVYRSLVPGGHMMLGWDADASPDPLENETILARFEHKEFGILPARHRVLGMEGHDHVFDWFRAAD
ncbi:class I SAM-dependent methyltransferase [Rhodopirellula bahusiensis]|uniref:class I SAM-dependent methyltransferase n=1 Tax=Rhodopirellula bahusiensis TaxID=2014065 RepID=UPI00326352E9